MTIQMLVDVWKVSGAHHSMKPPATEADIRTAEAKSIRYLMEVGLGDCVFSPRPPPDHYALTNANEKYIEYRWHTPQEIRLFADEGGSDVFGIYQPETGNPIYNYPIIEVGGMPDEDGCMGVVGTNLLPL